MVHAGRRRCGRISHETTTERDEEPRSTSTFPRSVLAMVFGASPLQLSRTRGPPRAALRVRHRARPSGASCSRLLVWGASR
eukprot:531624-Pyramimonas_sp.AAC.1